MTKKEWQYYYELSDDEMGILDMILKIFKSKITDIKPKKNNIDNPSRLSYNDL